MHCVNRAILVPLLCMRLEIHCTNHAALVPVHVLGVRLQMNCCEPRRFGALFAIGRMAWNVHVYVLYQR